MHGPGARRHHSPGSDAPAASGNRRVQASLRILRAVTEETPPPPESCANNMFRMADGGGRSEPSNLCRNTLGVFHMLDCPLFLGRPCTYYAAGEAPRRSEDDDVLEQAALELRRDFLSWGYGRRVRGLSQPADAWPVPIAVEAVDEPEESGIIAKRVAPEAEPEIVEIEDDLEGDDGESAPAESDAVDAEVDGAAAPAAAPGVRRPELYPGQRRSEERAKRKVTRSAPADEVAAPADDSDEAVEPAAPIEPPRARTVEELFAELPEAHLPDRVEPEERPRRGRRGGRSRTRSSSDGARGPGPRRDGAANKGEGAKTRDGAAAGRRSGGGGGTKKDESGAAGEAGGRRRRGRRRSGRSGSEAMGGEARTPRPGGVGDANGERTGGSAGGGEAGGDAGGAQRKPRRRRRRRGPPREGGSPPPAQ